MSDREASRRINYFARILSVQSDYNRHKEEGITDIYVYNKYIRSKYYISLTTFRKYLGVNAKRELRILEGEEVQDE